MAAKEIGLEINNEQTENRFMSHKQNVGKSHNRKINNKSLENVAKLIYLGNTPTSQN